MALYQSGAGLPGGHFPLEDWFSPFFSGVHGRERAETLLGFAETRSSRMFALRFRLAHPALQAGHTARHKAQAGAQGLAQVERCQRRRWRRRSSRRPPQPPPTPGLRCRAAVQQRAVGWLEAG